MKRRQIIDSLIIEWHKLDHTIRNSSSSNIFRKKFVKFIRPSVNSFFSSHNPKGTKFITRLGLGLSHLREHKFKHSFQDSLNPFCNCRLDNWINCALFSSLPHVYYWKMYSPDHHIKNWEQSPGSLWTCFDKNYSFWQ